MRTWNTVVATLRKPQRPDVAVHAVKDSGGVLFERGIELYAGCAVRLPGEPFRLVQSVRVTGDYVYAELGAAIA